MKVNVFNVTIPSGQAASNVVYTEGMRIVAVVTPPAMTGTVLTIHGGVTDTTMPMYDEVGSTIAFSAIPNAYLTIDWLKARAPFVRLVSNANEAASRTLSIVCEEEI